MKLRTHAKRLCYSLLAVGVCLELFLITMDRSHGIAGGLFMCVYSAASWVTFEAYSVAYYLTFKEHRDG